MGGSAPGFALGISLYWVVLRFMAATGIVAPEVQTIAWFGVTLIGVGVLSGKFLSWAWLDQAVAVLAGTEWVLVRTGG